MNSIFYSTSILIIRHLIFFFLSAVSILSTFLSFLLVKTENKWDRLRVLILNKLSRSFRESLDEWTPPPPLRKSTDFTASVMRVALSLFLYLYNLSCSTQLLERSLLVAPATSISLDSHFTHFLLSRRTDKLGYTANLSALGLIYGSLPKSRPASTKLLFYAAQSRWLNSVLMGYIHMYTLRISKLFKLFLRIPRKDRGLDLTAGSSGLSDQFHWTAFWYIHVHETGEIIKEMIEPYNII